MTPAPLPPPPVRLDVRLLGGRAVGYPVNGDFLIGASTGCDLRLPGGDLPPVVAQFSRHGDALRFQRRSATPVTRNGQPVAGDAAFDVNDGDRIAIGPVDITVVCAAPALIHPKLVPLTVAPANDPDLRQAALDEQARELEEDRRLWYARRQEMESELERMRAQLLHATPAANDAALRQREAELFQRQAEVATARQNLEADYESKRGELNRLLERLRGETDQFESRKAAFEAEMADRRERIDGEMARRHRDIESEIDQRRLEIESDLKDCEPRLVELRLEREQTEAARRALDAERASIRELRDELARERTGLDAERQWQVERIGKQEADLAGRDADFARREEQLRAERLAFETARDAHKEDLLRLDRWQGSLDQRQTLLDARAAEIDERFIQMRRDAADLEEQLHRSAMEEERQRGEAERLDRLKADIDAQAALFAERSAQVEAQQATLAVLRAKLDRQQEEIASERETLAAERQKQDEVRRDLDGRLRDAELLRDELGFLREDHDSRRQAVQEQQSLLGVTQEEIRRQKEEIAAADAKFKEREEALDAQSALIAEQAATLKAKLVQALELQQRLEADRLALREREAALAEAEAARQALQEQLRKRADDLNHRGRHVDGAAREVAEEKVIVERGRGSIDEWKAKVEAELTALKGEMANRAAELDRQAAALAERETALNRQVERMKEVSATVAADRKALFEARQAWEAEQANFRQQDLLTRHDSEAFQSRVAEQVAEMRRQAPDLVQRATAALDKLGGARDALRGHLNELHEYARQTRKDLAERSQTLEQAEAEHRLAVTAFRQQLHEWQAKVAELRQSMNQADVGHARRHADLDAAEQRIETLKADWDRRLEEMREEQRIALDKRNEMERHLADMREWYRHKLRDLAAGRAIDDADMPAWEGEAAPASPPILPMTATAAMIDADPADRQLGERLVSRSLLDAAMLQSLQDEARRQRKSLRQALLASGVVTVYQLALIESDNLDGLVMDRFRVLDRVRAGPRETVYRVFDPERPGELFNLRLLGEADSRDAVRRDEFHGRFAAATKANHANLVNALEVLDVQGRPAVLQEVVAGLPSSDWPPLAATPGVWLQLLAEATRGLAHAHAAGLVHGRLGAEAFILTADGTLKIAGFGEPGWLAGSNAVIFDSLPAADLRALGRVAFGWSQIGAKRRTSKAKAFPAELTAVIRRLETGAASPMDDIVSLETPYADANELLAELDVLAIDHPCPDDVWTKLLATIGEADDETPLRQTA